MTSPNSNQRRLIIKKKRKISEQNEDEDGSSSTVKRSRTESVDERKQERTSNDDDDDLPLDRLSYIKPTKSVKDSTWEKFWPKFVSALEQKATNSAMTETDARNVMNYWIPEMEDMKRSIVANCASHLNQTSFSQYDIRVDDRKWTLTTDLLKRLNVLLTRDERRTTDNLDKLISLKQRANERQLKQQRETDQENKTFSKLKSKPDVEQLKYFIDKYGPINGKKEYSEWKGFMNLKDGVNIMANTKSLDTMLKHSERMTKRFSDKLKTITATGGRDAPIIEEEEEEEKQVAIPGKKKSDDDYDDLLDGSLF